VVDMSDMGNITERLGRDIRDRRLQLGLTQQDVADISGLGRDTIGRVEHGDAGVRAVTLCAVARAVGLEVAARPRYREA